MLDAAMASRGRTFWVWVVAAAEAGGAQAEVAARYGTSVGALRSWLYKLRKERGGPAASLTLRLLPATVQAEPTGLTFGLRVDAGDPWCRPALRRRLAARPRGRVVRASPTQRQGPARQRAGRSRGCPKCLYVSWQGVDGRRLWREWVLPQPCG